ncbi:MAG: AhpC/TSA family protein [Bacteriovoracaceae bacterium]|nr:AhpC/TSA family protein [Bacteriovoracaceae bacterium]
MSHKLKPGEKFPNIEIPKLGGGSLKVGAAQKENTDWQVVFVYRGKHCPICTKFLDQVESMKEQFYKTGVDVVAISCDPEEKAKAQTKEKLNLNFDIGYDLSLEQAQNLGLYISNPRSPQETDRPFSEPAMFVVNEKGNLHVVDVANNPFVRPDLETLLNGLKFIKNPENDYPIRGARNY